MDAKVTAPKLRAMKGGDQKIVCLTAYDYPSAWIADEGGVDLILVGDSLGNVVLGFPNTLSVTLEHMCHHTAAVARGVRRALLIADLPFGAYNASPAQAMDSSVALVRAGAEGVKLEGDYGEAVALVVKAGVPVMGHLGFTPQSVHRFGGHRVQGKGSAADRLVEAAKRLEDAGAFSLVLELVPAETARLVTDAVSIPTIGIGAGPGCDGQIQVFHDILGLEREAFRHAKKYVDGAGLFEDGVRRYVGEVRGGQFPTAENSF